MSEKNIKCPLDGRSFATRKALKQHNVASHSGGQSRPRMTNMKTGQQVKNPRGKRETSNFSHLQTSGTDLIGSVTVSDSDPTGKLLLAWDINPTTLADTRLAQLARTFARWRPKKLSFEAVPGMGVFTPGSYAMGWVGDPQFQLGATSSRLARILTLSPNVLATFGQPRRLSIPTETSQKWYFCESGDEKEAAHGMVLVVLAALVGGKNLTINFKLDWTIEFSSAEMPPSTSSVEIYPDPTYVPIFTDSVSDWAGGDKLTFKHAEGGSVVPWEGVRSDMTYTPLPGVKIPYVKEDGSSGDVKWFAAIGGVYPTGLACFASEADAKAYVKTKDFAKALKYKAAGAWATPVLPTLRGQEVEAILLDLRLSTLMQRQAVITAAKASALNTTGFKPHHPVCNVNTTSAQSSQLLSTHMGAATSKPALAVVNTNGTSGPASMMKFVSVDEDGSEDGSVSAGESS